jgi:MoCo/4Fe-4S cofactor protein with predicted Tat translocation signal
MTSEFWFAKQSADGAPFRASWRTRFPPSAQLWGSLDELSQSDDFWKWASREFPEGASEFHDRIGRREFLRVMGATLAMMGLGACSRPPQTKIIPYLKQPEEIKPDHPLYFSTAMTLGGFATGLLVRSNAPGEWKPPEGRHSLSKPRRNLLSGFQTRRDLWSALRRCGSFSMQSIYIVSRYLMPISCHQAESLAAWRLRPGHFPARRFQTRPMG